MNFIRLGRWLLLTAMASLLLSCAGEQTPVTEPADGPPLRDLKPKDVADAIPRPEPLARYGNQSPYEVFGRSYRVLPSSEGYIEEGIASWYGSKFHGRRTSSGEPYDMHLATAAHRTLPLPTYAEITNLDNGRKVIVKINDRGPFKDNRLVDLSYGAALRLDMISTGTARVELRVIDPPAVGGAGESLVASNSSGDGTGSSGEETWLQAGAYGRREGAEKLASQLERAKLNPVSIHQLNKLFRVWLGPYTSNSEVESVIARAIELGFERPHRVSR